MSGDELYLKHILDAIEKVESYVAVGRENFMAASHRQDAVVRQLEIIGQAAKRIPGEPGTQHNEVPWRDISCLRAVPLVFASPRR